MKPDLHIFEYNHEQIEKIVVEKALSDNLPTNKLYDIVVNWCDNKIEVVFIGR